MPNATVSLPVLPSNRPMRLTPTDVTQFVRLEQCERYPALPAGGTGRAEVHGRLRRDPAADHAAAVPVGPHLRGGHRDRPRQAAADRQLRREVSASPTTALRTTSEVVQEARKLLPGQTVLLFQPRLEAELAGWLLRGDVDLAAAGAGGGRHAARPHRRHEIHRRGQGRTPPPGRLLPAHAGANSQGRRHQPQPVQMGILYRPPADPTPEDEEEIKPLRDAAKQVFGLGRRSPRNRRRPGSLPPVGPRPGAGQGIDGPPSGRHPVRGDPLHACPSSATAASTTNSA